MKEIEVGQSLNLNQAQHTTIKEYVISMPIHLTHLWNL